MQSQRLATIALPLANVLAGGVLLVEGGKLIRHGQPGVCELHEHTPVELQSFIVLGMAAVVPAIGLVALATWMVFNKPFVNLVYLAGVPVVIATRALCPTLPGLTPDVSFCVASLMIFGGYWYLCPRITKAYKLVEQVREQANIGLKLFSVFGIGFIIPYETLKLMMSRDQLRLCAMGFLAMPFLIYFSIKHWRLAGSRLKPMLLCVSAAISTLVAIDLSYQYWWPNPFAPTIVQSQFEFFQEPKSRTTNVGWKEWQLSIVDYTEGLHEISTGIGPSSARIQGRIIVEDRQFLEWSIRTSDLRLFECVINDERYYLSKGRRFQVALIDDELLLEQVTSGKDQLERFRERIGIAKTARANVLPAIQSTRRFFPGDNVWFRETNFFFSNMNSATDFHDLASIFPPDLQISSDFDTEHFWSQEKPQGTETVSCIFAIAGQKRQRIWQVITDGKQILSVRIDANSYDINDGTRFLLSAENGKLNVRQSRHAQANLKKVLGFSTKGGD